MQPVVLGLEIDLHGRSPTFIIHKVNVYAIQVCIVLISIVTFEIKLVKCKGYIPVNVYLDSAVVNLECVFVILHCDW